MPIIVGTPPGVCPSHVLCELLQGYFEQGYTEDLWWSAAYLVSCIVVTVRLNAWAVLSQVCNPMLCFLVNWAEFIS